MIVTGITGHENFATGSARFQAFVVPTRSSPPAMVKELALGFACRTPSYPVRSQGTAQKVPAGHGMKAEIVGEWSRVTYDIAPGAMLKLFANRSAAHWGGMRTQANILLLVRDEAAYRKVTFPLVGHARAVYTEAYFEGRFDVVPLTDALRMGARIPQGLQGAYQDIMVQQAFTVVELQPELVPAMVHRESVVTNSAGEQVQVVIPTRGRVLDL